MQFSESWLRQYVNPALNTQELAHALTMAGLEVEETKPLAPPFTQVVVAKILDAQQHPDADRLRVCQVDAGQGQVLQIVCGAPNARARRKVVFPVPAFPVKKIGAPVLFTKRAANSSRSVDVFIQLTYMFVIDF